MVNAGDDGGKRRGIAEITFDQLNVWRGSRAAARARSRTSARSFRPPAKAAPPTARLKRVAIFQIRSLRFKFLAARKTRMSLDRSMTDSSISMACSEQQGHQRHRPDPKHGQACGGLSGIASLDVKRALPNSGKGLGLPRPILPFRQRHHSIGSSRINSHTHLLASGRPAGRWNC